MNAYFLRRMRETVTTAAEEILGTTDVVDVVLAGLCNVYTHYIATFEEYQEQRFCSMTATSNDASTY